MGESADTAWTDRVEAYQRRLVGALPDLEGPGLLSEGELLASDGAAAGEVVGALALLGSLGRLYENVHDHQSALRCWSARVSLAAEHDVAPLDPATLERDLGAALDRARGREYRRIREDHPELDAGALKRALAWAAATDRPLAALSAYVDLTVQALAEGDLALARSVWAPGAAVARGLPPADRPPASDLVEEAIQRLGADLPPVAVDALVGRLQSEIPDDPVGAVAVLQEAIVLCDRLAQPAGAARLRAWLFYAEAVHQSAPGPTGWQPALDKARACGDERLVQLVLQSAPEPAALLDASRRRVVPRVVRWLHPPRTAVEPPVEPYWGEADSATVLHPVDPRARPDLREVGSLLRQVGLLAPAGEPSAAPGPRLSDWVRWTNPSPDETELARRARISVQAPRAAETPVLLQAEEIEPPRCPRCRALVGETSAIVQRLLTSLGEDELACPACEATLPVLALDWDHQLGLASCWITVDDLDPTLGRPADALLLRLERHTGVRWTWTGWTGG